MLATQKEPLTRESLRQYFFNGCKASNDLKIGVEWEKIGVYKESGRAIRYSGPRGVRTILKALVDQYGWTPVMSGPHPIALKKEGASITLEPGGQIELSGQKAEALHENAFELFTHLAQIRKVSEPLGIAWLGTGIQPISHASEIEWIPKKRYQIMRQTLKNHGSHSHQMMKETASIQTSLDYTSEKDAIQKLRLAMALAPFLSAIFANSPVSGGALSGFYSERAFIWRHTAPERAGIIQEVFRKDFSFGSYVEYTLDIPMIFIIRKGRWIPAGGMTFRDYLARPLKGYRPTLKDWELHLTTIFTESRLKTYLEIRSVDCQKMVLGLAAPAFLKGLFYDAKAREKSWGLLEDITAEERARLMNEVPRSALKTRFRGKTLAVPARELVRLAGEGLKRLGQKNPALKNDAKYLKPLEKLTYRGLTPADLVIKKFSPKKLPQLLSL